MRSDLLCDAHFDVSVLHVYYNYVSVLREEYPKQEDGVVLCDVRCVDLLVRDDTTLKSCENGSGTYVLFG